MKTLFYKNNWLEFSGEKGFALEYFTASYFDERPMIYICLFWGKFFIHLPFKTGISQCENPTYGFSYFYREILFYWNKKVKSIYVPWSWAWVRTKALRENGSWEIEDKNNRKSFYEAKWKKVLWWREHPYNYRLKSGKVQEIIATIKVTEMQWRWKILKWLPLFTKKRKTIDIKFSDEVGEETGSWKGGTIGCGYDMKKGESPLECLRRMEKERKF